MHRNEELHQFLVEKARLITEEWYNSLDKNDPSGVYTATNPEAIESLKQQNYEFHLHFCEVFIQEESQFFREFEKWIHKVAADEEHLKTPVHFIIREFFRTQEQYLQFIKEFVQLNEGKYPNESIESWKYIISKTISKVIAWFSEEHHKFSQSKLKAQQELIRKLSSPIIKINSDKALLPIVGDIDIDRANFMLENTLKKCSEKEITHLFIDLSGVVTIDTVVAHQIFQLIDALALIGVTCTLSGIRPEIAQKAVQLGIPTDKLITKSTLAKAIASSR